MSDRWWKKYRCCEVGHWASAEAACLQKLALAADDPSKRSEAHGALSSLYTQLGWNVEALQQAHAAVAAARERVGTRGWKFWLCYELERQARCALRARDAPQALEAISEAARCLPDETLGDRPTPPGTLATILVMQARCLLENGDLAAAQSPLAQAWDVLEANQHCWGKWSAIMPWWETTARLRTSQGDHHGAVEAWAAVVALRRVRGSGFLLSEVLDGLGHALLAAGDEAAAQDALDEGRALRLVEVPSPEEHGGRLS